MTYTYILMHVRFHLSILLSFFTSLDLSFLLPQPPPPFPLSLARTLFSIPVVGWYLPAPQSLQLVEPAVAWNLPAGHKVHAAASEEVDPSEPYLPAAHKEPEQVEGAVAPTAAEYLPV